MAYPGDYLANLAKRHNRAELLKLYIICLSYNLSSPQGLRCLNFIHGLDWVKLPNEILTLIAEQCHLTDCCSLSLTSKRLNEANFPAIYRDVDLSIHNRGVFKLQPNSPSKYDSSSFFYCRRPSQYPYEARTLSRNAGEVSRIRFVCQIANVDPPTPCKISSWNTLHQNYHNITPSTWLAGPMQNLLGPIAARCPKQTSLKIWKVGQRHWRDFDIPYSSTNQDLYSELATFIGSVKGTLEHLTFDQGEEEHKFCWVVHYRIRGV